MNGVGKQGGGEIVKYKCSEIQKKGCVNKAQIPLFFKKMSSETYDFFKLQNLLIPKTNHSRKLYNLEWQTLDMPSSSLQGQTVKKPVKCNITGSIGWVQG